MANGESVIDAVRRWLGRGVELVQWNDDGILALEKPAGVCSHPNRPGVSPGGLFRLPYDFQRQAYITEEGQLFYLLNRLDSATGGILVCVTNPHTARAVREAFRRRTVKKTYLAYVFGRMETGERIWHNHLTTNRIDQHVRTREGGDRVAISRVTVEGHFQCGDIPISRLRLQPMTGRTHQLRIQCALRRLPIVGDKIYGNFPLNRQFSSRVGRLALQLKSVAIKINYGPGRRHFSCESPRRNEFFAIEANFSRPSQRF